MTTEEIQALPMARNLWGEEMVVLTRGQRDWAVSEVERLRKEKQNLVELFCKQGVQYCYICEDKTCGDNINPALKEK